MSETNKKFVQDIKEAFRIVEKEAGIFKKTASTMDKELSQKIEKAEKVSREIIDHIEKRSER